MNRRMKKIDRLSKLLVKSAFEKTPSEKKEMLRLWSRLHFTDSIYLLPHDFAKKVLSEGASHRSEVTPKG